MWACILQLPHQFWSSWECPRIINTIPPLPPLCILVYLIGLLTTLQQVHFIWRQQEEEKQLTKACIKQIFYMAFLDGAWSSIDSIHAAVISVLQARLGWQGATTTRIAHLCKTWSAGVGTHNFTALLPKSRFNSKMVVVWIESIELNTTARQKHDNTFISFIIPT